MSFDLVPRNWHRPGDLAEPSILFDRAVVVSQDRILLFLVTPKR